MNKNKNSTSSLAFLFRQNSIKSNTQNQSETCVNTTPVSIANNISISFSPQCISDASNTPNEQNLSSLLFESYMEFPEFVNLFKSFYIHMRKDLKDIFERLSIPVNSRETNDQDFEITWQSTRRLWKNLIYKSNQNFVSQQQASSSAENGMHYINDQLTHLTRNNLEGEHDIINSFKDLIDSTDVTIIGSKANLNQVKEKYTDLLFHLQNQMVKSNNNRLFCDLIASNSISPYTVNCSSELLILNYFR